MRAACRGAVCIALTCLGACKDDSAVGTESMVGGDNQPAVLPEPAAEVPAETEVPSVGKVTLLQGQVAVIRGEERVEVLRGMRLQAGDGLKTGASGKVQIKLLDGSTLATGPDSEVTVASLELSSAGRKGTIRVLAGRFWAQITPWTRPDASLYTFETPNAVAGVRGTTLWGDTEADIICALQGQIEVTSTKAKRPRSRKLEAGQCASKLSKGKTKLMKPKKKKLQRYLEAVLIRP